MEIYKFYSANNPKLNEIVSCIIVDINEKENIVKLYLKDYNLNAIMSFKNATNRKKVRSWSMILPKGKEVVCKVDSIENRNDEVFIEVSKGFIDMDSYDVKRFFEEQKNNYNLKAIFKMLINTNDNFDMKLKWEETVYYFDNKREKESSDLFLYDFIMNNFQEFLSKFEKENSDKIIKMINKNSKIEKNNFRGKFGLYSKYYNDTVDIIKESLDNISNVDVKLEKVPYYYVYGDEENITNFCNNLIKNCLKKDKTFILQKTINDFNLEKVN
mgnify:CR=1 FL=1|jgi:hypothetical protein